MNTSSAKKYRNHLAGESSPYLLQHSGNPVDWYPWGTEALEKAQQENKMILVSIGYSACHWCHVMEKESFEDMEVARMMNENFVCIKVDREERPDIDQVYMNALQLLTGGGGWPLNCFALPDGSPVYGGTYFRREDWMQVLNYMAGIYANEKPKALEQAAKLKKGIQQTEFIPAGEKPVKFRSADPADYFSALTGSFDRVNGGFSGAPKFPMPCIYLFLLRYHHITGDNEALRHTLLTLDKMADGGIYDHLGGGFARYAVDDRWHVPHFEKMLYDNAQLVSLYSEAWQVSGNEKYRKVVYETVGFLERELLSDEGAFFSSLDADSENEEGKYYVWTKQEIDRILDKDSGIFCDYFNVTGEGNWEYGKNILQFTRNDHNLAERHHLTDEEATAVIEKGKALLFLDREKREKPRLDDKKLTSWNALAVKGLCGAYRAFGDARFLSLALNASEYIVTTMMGNDSSLKRRIKSENKAISAFLDDYALTAAAMISMYRSTFDERWLNTARELTEYALGHFFDPASSMFYYTSDITHDLVVRKMEITDNVIPSSNSVMAGNLFILARYFDNRRYMDISSQMLSNIVDDLFANGRYYANWGIVMLNHLTPQPELAIAGTNAERFRKQLERNYFPEIILAGSSGSSELPLLRNRQLNDSTLIYVCENYACNMPLKTIDEAVALIRATH